MYQFLVEYHSWITLGNILNFVSGTVLVLTAIVYGYFKLRTLWAELTARLEHHMEKLVNEQTKHLENCIHNIPGHPENPVSIPPTPIQPPNEH